MLRLVSSLQFYKIQLLTILRHNINNSVCSANSLKIPYLAFQPKSGRLRRHRLKFPFTVSFQQRSLAGIIDTLVRASSVKISGGQNVLQAVFIEVIRNNNERLRQLR